MYKQMLHDIARYPNKQNLASQVKDIVIKLNFEDAWTNQNVVNYSSFIQDIKDRVKLQFIQETNTRLNNSTRAVSINIYTRLKISLI